MSPSNDVTGKTRRHFLASASAATAAGVLAGPVSASARQRPAKPALQFTDTAISAGDVILGARSIGSGEPIVIHPSLARGALDFDPLARQLAVGGYRVISIDPRGIGQSWAPSSALEQNLTLHSYAADMLAVIRHFGLRKAHVLGHAFGNRVARTLATDHPEVTQTVILCACGGGIPTAGVVQGLSAVTDPMTSAADIRRWTREIFFAPGNDPRPWYLGWYAVPGRAEQGSVGRTDFTKIEGGGKGPMLVVQGKNDIVAPPSIGHALRTKYGSRITVHDIADAGHAMIIEKTEEVAMIILRYLARHRIRH